VVHDNRDPTVDRLSDEEAAQLPRATRWRSPAVVLLMLVATVGLGIPFAITLTPTQETTVAGQYLGVGASTPSGGWLGDLSEVFDDGPGTWPGAAADGFTGPGQHLLTAEDPLPAELRDALALIN